MVADVNGGNPFGNGGGMDGATGVNMFQMLRDVEKELAAIGGTLYSLNENVRRDRQETEDHESRLRALESRMWWAMGACAGFASGLTALFTKILGVGP